MSVRGTIDGAGLSGWARRSTATLEQRREEINALNIFPVPDSDTGSNMAATMSSAVAAADDLGDEGVSADRVAVALATGALRGARGNSGTVLSQVLRALAEAARPEGITGEQISRALTTAVDLVDRALAEPVEGTILTVLREAATAATANGSGDLRSIVDDAASAARTALENTPSQLDVLRDAGVVDAGGAGLVIMLDALAEEVGVDTPPAPDMIRTHGGGAAVGARDDDGELEVMFLIRLADADVDALSDAVSSLGNSLVVGGDGQGNHMVHIHTTEAGAVIERALDFGRPHGIRVEVLHPHHQRAEDDHSDRVVIAVIRPGQIADLFRSYGAVTVDPGTDPVEAVRTAVDRVEAGVEVILLPNGNLDTGELEQVESAVAAARELRIVRCPTVVHGMAAFAVHVPEEPLATDVDGMERAATGVRAADVIRRTAESASVVTIDGVESVLDCELPVAVVGAVDKLLEEGGELVTLLLGDETDPDCVTLLREHLRQAAPAVELSTYAAGGIGQRVLVGVE